MKNDELTGASSDDRGDALSAFHVKEGDNMMLGQLYFWTRKEWKGEVPADQNELRVMFDDVCAVLRARLQQRSPDQFRAEFARLLQLARATFGSEYAQVAQGRKSLDAYKAELIRQEGPAIKDAYLRELAISALLASIVIIVAAIVIRIGIFYGEYYHWISIETTGGDQAKVLANSIRWSPHFSPLHFGFLLASAMWGIWLSFVVRNMNFTFEQLQHPESDLMRPWSRLLAFGLLALILALFFQMQVLIISIGGVSTSQISDNLLIAVFVGLCLGFTDKALPGEVRRHIEEFFQSARSGPP